MKVRESRDSFVIPTWLIEISLSSECRPFSSWKICAVLYRFIDDQAETLRIWMSWKLVRRSRLHPC